MKATLLLILALLLGFFSGCGSSKKEAQSLVKAGTASSEQLVKYYESLVDADTKYIRILSYSTGARLNKSEKKILEQERKAYASRADLARKLNSTYVALGQLIDFDVAADIKGPVGDLTTAVLKQVPHPSQLDSDVFKTVITKIAGRLVEIQQEKQFRKNAPRVLAVLDGVGEIFERERPLYVQTAQLYEDEASKLALTSIGDGTCGSAQTTGIAMLEDLYEPYRVKPFQTPETDPRLCRKNHDYFAALITELARERKVSARSRARNISHGLYSLERVHRSFLREKPTAPSLVATDVENTDKLVANLKEALIARAAWEKAQQVQKQQAPPATPEREDEESVDPEYVPAKGAVADYVARLLSPAIKDALLKGGDTSSKSFRKMLTDDLNRIIETGNIFEGILLKPGEALLDKYRTSTSARERPGFRRELIKFVGDSLVSDRAAFTQSAKTNVPAVITDLVAVDPEGKTLASLNRAILAFVFVNSIAPVDETLN
jgi:hypothetical protein